jgi:hypothetical protein
MAKYIGRNHWFRYFVGTQRKGCHLVYFFVGIISQPCSLDAEYLFFIEKV